jgi:hypothetical protein
MQKLTQFELRFHLSVTPPPLKKREREGGVKFPIPWIRIHYTDSLESK